MTHSTPSLFSNVITGRMASNSNSRPTSLYIFCFSYNRHCAVHYSQATVVKQTCENHYKVEVNDETEDHH